MPISTSSSQLTKHRTKTVTKPTPKPKPISSSIFNIMKQETKENISKSSTTIISSLASVSVPPLSLPPVPAHHVSFHPVLVPSKAPSSPVASATGSSVHVPSHKPCLSNSEFKSLNHEYVGNYLSIVRNYNLNNSDFYNLIKHVFTPDKNIVTINRKDLFNMFG